MGDSISQPADVLKAAMDYGTGEFPAWECHAETGLPERPVIALRRKVSPETEHKFGYDLAWGSRRTACVADGCGNLVLRIIG